MEDYIRADLVVVVVVVVAAAAVVLVAVAVVVVLVVVVVVATDAENSDILNCRRVFSTKCILLRKTIPTVMDKSSQTRLTVRLQKRNQNTQRLDTNTRQMKHCATYWHH